MPQVDSSNSLHALELSRDRFPRTREVLESALAEKRVPGLVAGFWSVRAPSQFWQLALGEKIQAETIFDLASLTKALGTATLAALLVDRKWIDWETPVQSILADFKFPEIRLRHLLAHTAGFSAWAPIWEMLRDEFAPQPLETVRIEKRQQAARKRVFAISPEAAPDQRALYSDISFLILGFALEEVTRLPLDQAIEKWVWKPMGAEGLYFHRVRKRGELDPRVAPTEESAWRRGLLQGQVHDDNAWAMGGYAGHAGAFGRVRDVIQVVKKLHEGFLTAATLQAAWDRVALPSGCSRTLGWDTPEGSETSARGFSARSVGHLGFTGTSLWIDRDAGVAATLLTNRVLLGRENHGIRVLRPKFHEALRSDWEKLK
jgi:CubicO group peptidase (beta-lactamase class C family)